MRISPIITNIQSTTKKSTNNYRNNKSNNYPTGIGFTGYILDQHTPSGFDDIYESDFKKGDYPEIKSIYKRGGYHNHIKTHYPSYGGCPWHEVFGKAYIADVDEYVDSYFLPEDVGYVVYYDKNKVPEMPKYNKIKDDFKDNPTKYKYDVERNRDWETVWKNHYQKQYDEMSKDKDTLYDDEKALRDQKLNELSQKMYFIGEKIDTYNKIAGLMGKAGDELVKTQEKDDLTSKEEAVSDKLSYAISVRDKYDKNIDKSKKEWKNASSPEKDEKRVLYTLERVKKRYKDYKISQHDTYPYPFCVKRYNSLDDEINGMTEIKDELQNKIDDINNSYEYNQAIQGHPDILKQMSDIYRDKLPDKIDN